MSAVPPAPTNRDLTQPDVAEVCEEVLAELYLHPNSSRISELEEIADDLTSSPKKKITVLSIGIMTKQGIISPKEKVTKLVDRIRTRKRTH